MSKCTFCYDDKKEKSTSKVNVKNRDSFGDTVYNNAGNTNDKPAGGVLTVTMLLSTNPRLFDAFTWTEYSENGTSPSMFSHLLYAAETSSML